MIEVGKSVQKFGAMMLAGFGGLYLLSIGHYEPGIGIITAILFFAIGDANGANRVKKYRPVPEELYREPPLSPLEHP